VLHQPAAEIGECLLTDVVAERFFPQYVSDAKIEDVGVFKLFVREVEQVFDDLQ